MANQEPGPGRMGLLIWKTKGLDQMTLKILSSSSICYSEHIHPLYSVSPFIPHSATQKLACSTASSEALGVRSYLLPKINCVPVNLCMKAGYRPKQPNQIFKKRLEAIRNYFSWCFTSFAALFLCILFIFSIMTMFYLIIWGKVSKATNGKVLFWR